MAASAFSPSRLPRILSSPFSFKTNLSLDPGARISESLSGSLGFGFPFVSSGIWHPSSLRFVVSNRYWAVYAVQLSYQNTPQRGPGRGLLLIAVGTIIADRPPRGPGRALISASGSYLGSMAATRTTCPHTRPPVGHAQLRSVP